MHFKRKKPKNARAGCLMCKPHKDTLTVPSARRLRTRRTPGGDFGGEGMNRCPWVR